MQADKPTRRDLVFDDDVDMADDFEDMVDDFDGVIEEEETPFIITSTGTEADEVFDRTVGLLEKIALEVEGEFPSVLQQFMKDNCQVFDEGDDNPHSYMDIFKEYTAQIETYLEQEVRREMPDFSMASFVRQLDGREDEISPDTLELLISLADFQTFKEMMLNEKAIFLCENAHPASPIANIAKKSHRPDLCVWGRESRIFSEEQEDGESFPDLNLEIQPHDSPTVRPKKRICG